VAIDQPTATRTTQTKAGHRRSLHPGCTAIKVVVFGGAAFEWLHVIAHSQILDAGLFVERINARIEAFVGLISC